jgi:hypothetical protein
METIVTKQIDNMSLMSPINISVKSRGRPRTIMTVEDKKESVRVACRKWREKNKEYVKERTKRESNIFYHQNKKEICETNRLNYKIDPFINQRAKNYSMATYKNKCQLKQLI